MGPIITPKTSVSKHFTPRNNPEGGIIVFNLSGSLRSRKNVKTVPIYTMKARRKCGRIATVILNPNTRRIYLSAAVSAGK
jgi:hypothetical protein